MTEVRGGARRPAIELSSIIPTTITPLVIYLSYFQIMTHVKSKHVGLHFP